MAKFLFVRIGAALAVISLALFFVGIIPFFSAAPSAGAVIKVPAFTVNREFKGDRLPVASTIDTAARHNAFRARWGSLILGKMPVGCEPAFSPVTAPRLAYYYGRCAT
jgi:hypothetical protein